MSKDERYKIPHPFLMGSQEAHDAHQGWYAAELEASLDRGLRRNLKPVEVDAGGMLNWATSWMQRGQEKRQQQAKVEIVDGNELEANFFEQAWGKMKS